MTQLVFGAAFGFIVGEGVLQGIKLFVGWFRRDAVYNRIRKLAPSRGSDLVRGFIRYAGLLGAVAALSTLGIWTVGDYLAARSARSVASAKVLDPSAPASRPHGSADDVAGLTPTSMANSSAAGPVDNVDPYADPDFRVRRRAHHAGTPPSLKETLLQRSEARARADLLRQTQEHVHRSQYDCEAAERAIKYLKASLDVWGFASWQLKYFPMGGYKGATIPQCKDIENVVEPSELELQSTVADGNHT